MPQVRRSPVLTLGTLAMLGCSAVSAPASPVVAVPRTAASSAGTPPGEEHFRCGPASDLREVSEGALLVELTSFLGERPGAFAAAEFVDDRGGYPYWVRVLAVCGARVRELTIDLLRLANSTWRVELGADLRELIRAEDLPGDR